MTRAPVPPADPGEAPAPGRRRALRSVAGAVVGAAAGLGPSGRASAWLGAAATMAAAPASAADRHGAARGAQAAPADVPPGIPDAAAWRHHLQHDLLPFWNQPDAWGVPVGNFPTFRCNDGRLPDPVRTCPELAQAPAWIQSQRGRQQVRMLSRQTFFYGAAFHLTGDPALLSLALAGADHIRGHALERGSGSAASWWEDGQPGPPPPQRTAQDLAYAQLGLAMVYHLTRDPAVGADLQLMKAHLFDRYWDDRWQMMRWVQSGAGTPDEDHQELVAQLDPINACMLLVTPLLPANAQAAWRADMQRLAAVMIDRYWWPEEGLFRGTLHDPAARGLGTRHVDFGHTAKALWMIERIGRLTGHPRLTGFATVQARHVLARAFVAASGQWASRPRADGSLDLGREWWIHAELNQTAATLALADPAFARPLPATYADWLRHMVDRRHGEVWGWVGADGQPGASPKIHHWKSGYHSAEHALVGAITGQALRGAPVTLHFALHAAAHGSATDGHPRPAVPLRPYLFSARRVHTRVGRLPGHPALRHVRATFDGIA